MKWVFWIFVTLYGLAVFLLLTGIFGWFGENKDPLSAAFLLPLGLPWNVLADQIGLAGVSSLVLAPAINAGILYWLWQRLSQSNID